MATLDNYVINTTLKDQSRSVQGNISIFHGKAFLTVSLHEHDIVDLWRGSGQLVLRTKFEGKCWDTTSTKRAIQRALDQLGVPGYVKRLQGRVVYECPSLGIKPTIIGRGIIIESNGALNRVIGDDDL